MHGASDAEVTRAKLRCKPLQLAECQNAYLHDLCCVIADHVAANNDVGLGVDHNLHKRAQRAARHGVAHGAEAGGVHIHVGVLLNRGFLSEALRRRQRMEHYWYCAVHLHRMMHRQALRCTRL